MPKRLQVADEFNPQRTLRPSARPVETFVRPGVENEATQLAQALATLSPALGRLAGTLGERSAHSQSVTGEQRARETLAQMDESRQTLADAVRSGLVPAHMNPWMKQGYYEELGRLYANRLNSGLLSEIDTNELLKSSIELGDFRTVTSDFEKKFLEQIPENVRNQAFNVGYGNRRDAVLANLEAGWAASTEQRFTQRSLLMFKDEAVQFSQDALDKERTPAEIGAFLRQMWSDKRALGWDGTQTGQALVDAVAAVALSRKDPELMRELLENVRGGDGTSDKNNLARTAYGIEKIEATDAAIFTARRREWEQNDRKRAEDVRQIMTTAIERFTQAEASGLDPDNIPINDLQQQALSMGNPQTVTNLITLKQAYQNDEYSDDNDLVADFRIRINRSLSAISQGELDVALRNKQLSLQTYAQLSNELQQAKTAGTRKAFLEDDPDHEYGERATAAYFGSNPDADTPEVATRRQQALRQFSKWYFENFVAENAPNRGKTGMDRRVMLDAQAQNLARTWVPYDDAFSGTFRLSGVDFDWKKRPVDISDRLDPLLDELVNVLSQRARPSPALLSLLSVYQVNPDDRAELEEFIRVQRTLLTQVTPPNASTKR